MNVAIVAWLGLVAGVFLVVTTVGSVVETVIVPRFAESWIARGVWRSSHHLFLFVANRMRDPKAQDRWLALEAPLALLVLLGAWLSLLATGFTLILWPLVGTLPGALQLAGSSLSTLGTTSAHSAAATTVSDLAAITGLGIVALQISYLPTIYSAYNRRELLINTLGSRAGEPAWGPELLAREQLVGGVETLGKLFEDWEHWAADVVETHLNYPWLLWFRSPFVLHSWLIGWLAILDAAALYLAISPTTAPPQARHCLRTGFLGMQTLATRLNLPVDVDPLPDAPLQLTFEEFSTAWKELAVVGFPVERSAAEAWPHMKGWRVNYEKAAYGLADIVGAVQAPWSGERGAHRYPAQVTRPSHRTPNDPQGRVEHLLRARAEDLSTPEVPSEADAMHAADPEHTE